MEKKKIMNRELEFNFLLQSYSQEKKKSLKPLGSQKKKMEMVVVLYISFLR